MSGQFSPSEGQSYQILWFLFNYKRFVGNKILVDTSYLLTYFQNLSITIECPNGDTTKPSHAAPISRTQRPMHLLALETQAP